jgi:hypothetical protein
MKAITAAADAIRKNNRNLCDFLIWLVRASATSCFSKNYPIEGVFRRWSGSTPSIRLLTFLILTASEHEALVFFASEVGA